jgi:hypothetical protein
VRKVRLLKIHPVRTPLLVMAQRRRRGGRVHRWRPAPPSRRDQAAARYRAAPTPGKRCRAAGPDGGKLPAARAADRSHFRLIRHQR